MAEIMALLRKIPDVSAQMHAGKWNKDAKGCFEVRGKKLGIIGYGNIGSQLAAIAESMGMEVYYFNRSDKLSRGTAKPCHSLKELLRKVDIVTLHVYSSPENVNMIGAKELGQMKPGSYLINASRGDIVDVDALAKSLRSGHLAGAAVDVFPYEPKNNKEPFQSPLQGIPNVILTPHIGGSTEEAQRDIALFVSKRLIQFVNTGETTLSVNMPNLNLPPVMGYSRTIHIHHNVPGMLSQINNIIAKEKINIEGQYLKTNETIGYVILDISAKPPVSLLKQLKAIKETIKVRALY